MGFITEHFFEKYVKSAMHTFLPLKGTKSDLDMNGKSIDNLQGLKHKGRIDVLSKEEDPENLNIRIGIVDADGNDISTGIQLEQGSKFRVLNDNGHEIISLSPRENGTLNYIRGNETLVIESEDGTLRFTSADAGITYEKATWTEKFKQFVMETSKGIEMVAKNNSYWWVDAVKKAVYGNSANKLEFKTDGEAKFSGNVRTKELITEGLLTAKKDVLIPKNGTDHKLNDLLDEALDGTFKNRVVVTDMEGATFAEKLQAAVDKCSDGGTVFIPKSDTEYELDSTVIIEKSLTLLGDISKPVIKITTDITYGFEVKGYYDSTTEMSNVYVDFKCENIVFNTDVDVSAYIKLGDTRAYPVETACIANCEFYGYPKNANAILAKSVESIIVDGCMCELIDRCIYTVVSETTYRLLEEIRITDSKFLKTDVVSFRGNNISSCVTYIENSYVRNYYNVFSAGGSTYEIELFNSELIRESSEESCYIFEDTTINHVLLNNCCIECGISNGATINELTCVSYTDNDGMIITSPQKVVVSGTQGVEIKSDGEIDITTSDRMTMTADEAYINTSGSMGFESVNGDIDIKTPGGYVYIHDGVEISGGLIIPSSTPGSTKKFKITVDDNGTINATEV